MSKGVFNKILAKLKKLDEYVRYLLDIQKVNQKSFLANYYFYGAAERYLQLSIETMMDIGKLLIVSQDFRTPENNQDIFTILGEAKLLPGSLVESMEGIANFRNILVHDYEKIDRKKVYENLHRNIGQFKKFKQAMLRTLKKSF